MNEKHLLIIDGHNILRRVHSAIPEKEGVSDIQNAESACINTVRSIKRGIKEVDATHVVFVFDDINRANFRYQIFDQYKAKRSEFPAALRERIDFLKNALTQEGIHFIDMLDQDADDVVSSLASTASSHYIKTTILSNDKDFAQLIDQNIRLRDHFKKENHGVAWVNERFGVEPSQFTDFQALVGDTSDNIPGVKGIGPTKARQLLAQFGSLDNIYQNLESIGNASIKSKLIEDQESAQLSKTLVTLKRDINAGISLHDMQWRNNLVSSGYGQ